MSRSKYGMIPEAKGSVVNDNSVLLENCCEVRVEVESFRVHCYAHEFLLNNRVCSHKFNSVCILLLCSRKHI